MARKSDYFGLSYLVSVILAIIPVTAFVCGFITRILDGKILAGSCAWSSAGTSSGSST